MSGSVVDGYLMATPFSGFEDTPFMGYTTDSDADIRRGLEVEILEQWCESDLDELPPDFSDTDPDLAEKVWTPASVAQEMALNCTADILLYGGSAGSLKALALNTSIPTPSGWTTMGELQVGSEVFDEQGKACHVTALSPIYTGKKVYEVVFDDGTVIKACGDHRWQTMTALERTRELRQTEEWRERRRANRPLRSTGKRPDLALRNQATASLKVAPEYGQVRTTDELRASLIDGTKRLNHSVLLAGSLELPAADLPIDPYVLGAWLGDGHSKGASITCADPEILAEIEKAGHVVTKYSAAYEWGINGLHRPLRLAGLRRNKHIPALYLRASFEQRMALLQGLMDTDGTANPTKGCVFYNTNLKLMEQVRELLLSLGVKANITSWTAKLNGKDCGLVYGICFVATFDAFRLPRKLAKQKRAVRPTTRRRYIAEVREVATEPMRCITVDSPSHLYLASESFIPTHNSETLLVAASIEVENPNYNGIIFRQSFPELRDLVKKSIRLYTKLGGRFTKGSPLCWTFPSGATIWLGYLGHDDDVYAHQGAEYSFIGFDEAGHQTEARIRYMLTRLRSTDPTLHLRMFLTANPGGPGHSSLMHMFLKGICPHCEPKRAVKAGKLYFDATWKSDGQPLSVTLPSGVKVKKSVAFIPGKITDHTLLGDNYIANLMTQAAATAKMLMDGCWKAWEGQFFDCFDERRGWDDEGKPLSASTPGIADMRMVIPHTDLDIKWWYPHLVDGDYGFAGSSAAAHLLVQLPADEHFKQGRILVLDEYLEAGVTAKDYAQQLLDRWVLEEDGSGNKYLPNPCRAVHQWVVSPDAFRKDGSVNDQDVPFSRLEQMNGVLGAWGFQFMRANDDRKSGWMKLYQMLRDGDLIIARRCIHTIEALQTRLKDPKKMDDILKVAGDPLDDVCLVGDTRVLTRRGEVPIRDVQVGDSVWTRVGWKQVLASACTARDVPVVAVVTSDGRRIIGTPMHPFFTQEKGFLPANALRYGDVLQVCTASSPLECASSELKRSSIAGSSFGATQTGNAGRTGCTLLPAFTIAKLALDRSIRRYGRIIMARFLQATTSTTRTATQTTTGSKTTSACPDLSTNGSTCSNDSKIPCFAKSCWPSSLLDGKRQQRGTEAPKGRPGTRLTELPRGRSVSLFSEPATNAAHGTPRSQSEQPIASVRTPASRHGVERLASTVWRRLARFAGRRSRATSTTNQPPADVYVVSVCDAGRSNVYNLQVEDAHEFYANGILTHNCDSLRYGVMTWNMAIIKPRDIRVAEAIEGMDPTNAYMTVKAIELSERSVGRSVSFSPKAKRGGGGR